MSEIESLIGTTCRETREATRVLASAATDRKDVALRAAARRIRESSAALLAANRKDLAAATNIPAAFHDRLMLTPNRIEAMASGVDQILALPDPVGETIHGWRRPNGLEIRQVRVPIGVIGIIYESRPNVTADAAALCLRSGNGAVLKGGKEAIYTNSAIADLFLQGLDEAKLPRALLNLIRSTDRAATHALLRQKEWIDVLIPRGGESLIRAITETSEIPVIQHLSGVCQVFVDRAADLDCAGRIVHNAKVQRPGVCNAMENLLVHADVAETFLPRIIRTLSTEGVELRGCPRVREISPEVAAATEEDWSTEYLDKVLSIRVVESLEEALAFISRFGSGLADAIVTEDDSASKRFTAAVDSAVVLVNASTRFTDGFEFGFGAEIGISTNRLHARGPMGLRELTTYKYIVQGSGQIRE